jgi:hypothetical protein
MKKIVIGFAALLMAASPAAAEQAGGIWNGPSTRCSFETPRPGLFSFVMIPCWVQSAFG